MLIGKSGFVIEATKSSNIASTVFGILSDEEKLKDM
jgi:hypothetical protein